MTLPMPPAPGDFSKLLSMNTAEAFIAYRRLHAEYWRLRDGVLAWDKWDRGDGGDNDFDGWCAASQEFKALAISVGAPEDYE